MKFNRRQFFVLLFAPVVAAFACFLPKPKVIRKIYRDANGNVLVGYKGTTFLDAGYFYCPYIPLVI